MLQENNLTYNTYYFDQRVDHFNYMASNIQTWKMRYLITKNRAPYNLSNPIFVYLGNELDITLFYKNSGFLTTTLQQMFNATVIFLEHRFFGESMPFGNNSFSNENIELLTVEQTMADFVYFLKEFQRNNLSCFSDDCPPIIAFGGSYGGMLAAYMRIKFPNVVNGAIASSAPIWYFRGMGNDEGFYKIVTLSYQNYQNCTDFIREGFRRLQEFSLNLTENILTTLNQAFNLCPNSNITNSSGIQNLTFWLQTAFATLAELNYPYETDFLARLPAWPVQQSCLAFQSLNQINLQSISNQDLFSAIYEAANIYYDSQNELFCTNIYTDNEEDIASYAWDIVKCGSMTMPLSSNNITDMFPPNQFNYSQKTELCQQKFNLTPRFDWALDSLSGRTFEDLAQNSRIFFSNGEIDPWRAGGVNQSVTKELPAYIMKDSAHHLDLRLPNQSDPAGVIQGRNLEIFYLNMWINNPYPDGCSTPQFK